MFTDVCGQQRDDGGLVVRRVPHEALQAVEAAEADVDGRRAEVADGCLEPAGDLPPLGDPQLFAGLLDRHPGEQQGGKSRDPR
ncbi:hypothetical protein [Streptomyces sirii]|uniref:hypothetical protein n=1 Tax=Streptomyces sirii TaxID=3127701 RepID=UPI003D360E04